MQHHQVDENQYFNYLKISLRKDVVILSVTWDNLDSGLLTKQVAIFMCKQSL